MISLELIDYNEEEITLDLVRDGERIFNVTFALSTETEKPVEIWDPQTDKRTFMSVETLEEFLEDVDNNDDISIYYPEPELPVISDTVFKFLYG